MDTKTEIITKSYQIRGEILHLCIILENEIDDFICQHFSKDESKQLELFLIVCDKMSFDAKISTFEALLKKIHGGDFDKKHGKLLIEIRFVKEHRNIMAHHMVDIYDGYKPIKQGIGFINFKSSPTVKNYDKGLFKQVIDRTAKCIEVMRTIER